MIAMASPMQQTLASAIHAVLSAATEQICGLVEYHVTEYEDRDVSSKLQIETQRRILDELLKPRVTLHRAVISETTASDSWNSARTRRLSSALSVLGRDCNGRPGRRKDSRSSSSSSAHGELHTEGLATSAAEERPPPERPLEPPVDIPSLSPTLRASDCKQYQEHGRTEKASSQTDTAGSSSSRPPGVAAGAAKAKSPSLANAAAAPVVKAKESLPHPSSLSPCHVTVQDSMESTPVDAMMDRGEAGQMMKRCDRFGSIQTKTKKDAKLDTSISSCDDEETSLQKDVEGGQPSDRGSPDSNLTPNTMVSGMSETTSASRDSGVLAKDSNAEPGGSMDSRSASSSSTRGDLCAEGLTGAGEQLPAESPTEVMTPQPSSAQRRTEQQPPAAGRRSEPAADNIPSVPLTRSSSSTSSRRKCRQPAVRPKKASSDAAGSHGGKDEETLQKDVEDGQPSDRGSPDSNLTPTTMVSGMSKTTSASRDSGVLAKDSNAEPSMDSQSTSSSSTRGDLCAEGLTGAGEQLPAESPTEVMMTPQPSSAQRRTEQQPPAAGRLSEPAVDNIPSAPLTRSSSTTSSRRKYRRQPAVRPKKASSDAAGSHGGKAMDREPHQHLQHLFAEDDNEEDFLGFPATDEETSVQKNSEDGQPSDRGSPDSNLTPTTMVSGISETSSASRDSGILAKDSNAEPGGSKDSQSSSSTRGDLCAEGLTGAGKQLPAESPTEVMMTPQPSSALSMDSSVLAKDSIAEPGSSKDSRTSSAQGELYSEAAEQQLPAHSLSSAEVMAAHPPPALVIDFSILEKYSNADPGGSEESQSSSTRGALFSDGLTRTEKQLPVESPAEVMTPQVSPALIIDFSVLGKASEPGGSSVEPQSPSTRGELYSDGLTSLDRQLPAESPTGVRDQQPSSDLSVDPGILGKDSIAEPAGSKDSQAPSSQGEFYSERLGSTEQQLPAESAADIPPATFARRASNCRAYGRPRNASPDTAGNGSQPPVANRRGRPRNTAAAVAAAAAPVVKWRESLQRDCTLLKPMAKYSNAEPGGSMDSQSASSSSTRGDLCAEGLTGAGKQLPAESPTEVMMTPQPSSALSMDSSVLAKDSIAVPGSSKDSRQPVANRRGRPRNTAAAAVAARAAAAAAAAVVKRRESLQRDCTLLKPMSPSTTTFTDLDSIMGRSMDLVREATRATENMFPPPVKRSRPALIPGSSLERMMSVCSSCLAIEDKEGGGLAVDGSRRKIEYFGFEDLGKSDSDEERTQAKVTMEAALSTSMDVLQTQDSQDNQSSSNTDFLHLPVCKEVVSTEGQQRSPILVQEEPAPPPQS